MVVFTVAVIMLVAAAEALPKTFVVPPSMVTVPPNCPSGQVYWNGQCRWPWFTGDHFAGDSTVPQNAIQVPPNCKPGQQWINDACRDVWRNMLPSNVVTVPPNCPVGQVLVNGQCRDLWFTPEQLKLWASLVDNYKSIEEMFAQRAIAEGLTNKRHQAESIYY